MVNTSSLDPGQTEKIEKRSVKIENEVYFNFNATL